MRTLFPSCLQSRLMKMTPSTQTSLSNEDGCTLDSVFQIHNVIWGSTLFAGLQEHSKSTNFPLWLLHVSEWMGAWLWYRYEFSLLSNGWSDDLYVHESMYEVINTYYLLYMWYYSTVFKCFLFLSVLIKPTVLVIYSCVEHVIRVSEFILLFLRNI
jgi:hypothetical protein